MATSKITMREVLKLRRDAEGTPTGHYLWDTELRGFGVRASPTGGISWLFQHWVGGKGGQPKRRVFGSCPPMLIDEARAEAERLRGDVNNGVDILDRKAKRRLEQRKKLHAPKLGEAVALYLKKNSKATSYWQEIERQFEKEIIPALGKDTAVSSITKHEIRSIIDNQEDKGQLGAARYRFAVLRPFLKWCVDREIIPHSPMDGLKAPKPLEARDRVLSDAEIKAIWQATETWALFGPFYRLLLLTAQRREEVSGMEWKELDLDRATWVIPKERTKNGKEHLVHLSKQALAIINNTPKKDSSFVLTSTLETKITGYSKAKEKLDRAIKLDKPWRVHDLRRTAASGMAALGFQPHIIERVLNHLSGAQGGLVSVYQRHEYLPERKRALEAWGTYVENLVTEKETTDNVTSLVRA